MSWDTTSLDKIVTFQRGFDLPKTKFKNGLFPVVGSTNIIGYHDEFKVNPPCVVTGRSGTLGKFQYMNENFWPHNTTLWVKDFKGNNPKYVYYLLKTLNFSFLNGGASVPTLNRNVLKSINLKYSTSLKTQKCIADILSAYDDLIENNLKRIKLLEQAAQNIYNEWFVNLRFPGHENTPINKEAGLPEGWEVKKLKEYVDFKEGPGLRNWQYRTKGVPFLNIRMMNSGELNFSSVKYLEAEEVNNKYKHFLLNEFDLIISTSGTLGKVVTIRKSHLPLCLNTSIIRLRPIYSRIGKWYIKRKVSSKEFIDEMNSFATGSAQLNFGPKHLNMMDILLPNEDLGKEYERLTNPLELKILALLDYNQKLKAARDILLPRLMNRTIEV